MRHWSERHGSKSARTKYAPPSLIPELFFRRGFGFVVSLLAHRLIFDGRGAAEDTPPIHLIVNTIKIKDPGINLRINPRDIIEERLNACDLFRFGSEEPRERRRISGHERLIL